MTCEDRFEVVGGISYLSMVVATVSSPECASRPYLRYLTITFAPSESVNFNMPLASDLNINATRFQPGNITEETTKTNHMLENVTRKGPQWYEVGAAKYRQMHEKGETPFPIPVYLPGARDGSVPSREAGREIPIRIYAPDNGQPSQGVFLHIHGGGFVFASHKHYDLRLRSYANAAQLTVVSVGYRLAPENPYPAAPQDCIDAAEYFVDNAECEYGAKLVFMGGESAGATLVVLTTFHLMRTRPAHHLKGLVLAFGFYDLTLSMTRMSLGTRPLVIYPEVMKHYADAYLPNMSFEDKRSPSVSPLYEDLQALVASDAKIKLPPALFIVGTLDPLLQDTLMMTTRWQMAGGESVVQIWPGEAHMFSALPTKSGKEASAMMQQFIQEKVNPQLSQISPPSWRWSQCRLSQPKTWRFW